MSDIYICSICKGEFEKGWSDEEALVKKNENFDDIEDFSNTENCDLVCNDCYKEIMLLPTDSSN